MKFIIGSANLDQAIRGFHAKAASVQRVMHTIACSVLNHAIEHGDIRPMATFIASIPVTMSKKGPRSAYRVKTLIEWFEEFGPVTFDKDVPSFSKAKRDSADLDAAVALPFWEFKPEVTKRDFDMVASLKKLIEAAVKADKADLAPVIGVLKAQLAGLTQGANVQ